VRSLLAAIALPLGLLLASEPDAAHAENARAILGSMEAAGERIRDYTMILVKQERRLDGLEPEQRMLAKWARPQRVYFKHLEGDHDGQEAIYSRGANRDRLRAHKGSFPDVTVDLDPRGARAMAQTHHPVTEASLLLLVELVLRDARNAEERREGTLRLVGREPMLGRPCFRIEMTYPADTSVHVVREGETLWDVAEKHGSDMFVVLVRNKEKRYRGPADPRPGDRLLVPRYYAGRVELWVDVETRLPLVARIYGHDGALYERYEHHELRTNVGLTDLDFDPANPVYDF
jgi:hypothetical protein